MVRTKPTRLKDSDASVGRSSEFWCRLQPVRFSIILQPAINFFWRFHSISHTASLLDRLFALILEEAAPHLFLTSIHTLVEFYTATERKHVFNTPYERTSLHRRPTGRKSIRTHPQIRLSAIQLQTNRHEPTRLAQKPARGHGIPSQTHRGQKPVQSHIMAPCRTALHPLYVPPPNPPPNTLTPAQPTRPQQANSSGPPTPLARPPPSQPAPAPPKPSRKSPPPRRPSRNPWTTSACGRSREKATCPWPSSLKARRRPTGASCLRKVRSVGIWVLAGGGWWS